MKTSEIKVNPKLQIKWAGMTANMQDYNNPLLPRYILGGRGDTIPNKAATKHLLNMQ